MEKKRILFLCIHNSARSQMAEAYLKKFGSEYFEADSAGLEAGTMNPLAVEAMGEDGIDISKNESKEVELFLREGRSYDYVITVCDEAGASRCPVFPGAHRKINWNFPDPSVLQGPHDEKMKTVRSTRDKIRTAVQNFVADFKQS